MYKINTQLIYKINTMSLFFILQILSKLSIEHILKNLLNSKNSSNIIILKIQYRLDPKLKTNPKWKSTKSYIIWDNPELVIQSKARSNRSRLIGASKSQGLAGRDEVTRTGTMCTLLEGDTIFTDDGLRDLTVVFFMVTWQFLLGQFFF